MFRQDPNVVSSYMLVRMSLGTFVLSLHSLKCVESLLSLGEEAK